MADMQASKQLASTKVTNQIDKYHQNTIATSERLAVYLVSRLCHTDLQAL